MFYQIKIHLNVLVLNIFSFSSSSRIYILHWWVSDQPIKSRFSVLLIFSANLSKYCIFVQFQRKSFFKTAATVLEERALLIFIAFSTRLPHCWNKCRCLGHFTSRGTRTSEVYVDVMVGICVNPGNIRSTDSERLLFGISHPNLAEDHNHSIFLSLFVHCMVAAVWCILLKVCSIKKFCPNKNLSSESFNSGTTTKPC